MQDRQEAIQADSALLADVLPEASGQSRHVTSISIAETIRARLDAGWSRGQIRHTLASRELPGPDAGTEPHAAGTWRVRAEV